MIPEEEYAPWKWEPQHLGSAFAVLLTFSVRWTSSWRMPSVTGDLYNLGVSGIHEIVSLSTAPRMRKVA